MVAGLPTVREAAAKLGVSRSNVYASLRRIARKLGITSVSELIAVARGGGLHLSERDALLARCSFPSAGTPLDCAVSGGPDSLALIVLATAAGCLVTAWHVDHGLRAGSAAEADLVEEAAARYGAAMRRVHVSVAPGPNLEDRLRRARFGALPDGVATGHTADDQAETMVLALLRGTGLDGLRGMAAGGGATGGGATGGRATGGGAAHPLLALRRAETVALCQAEGLTPFTDPSNADPRWWRNRVRAELLPLAADIAGRDVVPSSPAPRRCCGPTPSCSPPSPGRSTRPTRGVWPRRRPPRPGGRSGVAGAVHRRRAAAVPTLGRRRRTGAGGRPGRGGGVRDRRGRTCLPQPPAVGDHPSR